MSMFERSHFTRASFPCDWTVRHYRTISAMLLGIFISTFPVPNFLVFHGYSYAHASPPNAPLPGTSELTEPTPLSDRILDGSKEFLLQRWEEAASDRQTRWRSRIADPNEFAKLQEQTRAVLIEITGSHDPRTTPEPPQWIRSLYLHPDKAIPQPTSLAAIHVRPLQWNVLAGFSSRGLWVGIPDRRSRGTIILRPDAGVTLHAIAGHVKPESEPKVANRSTDETRNLVSALCSAGFDVIVVQPISRASELRRGRVELTDQEYVYRLTNVLGRHPIGIEIQSIRALVDWLAQANDDDTDVADARGKDTVDKDTVDKDPGNYPIGLIGHGDGGFIAMLTAAIDTRVDAVMASGGWGNLEGLWQQPIGRNVFNLVPHVSDAELAAMIAPRRVIIEASECEGYEVRGRGAAPAEWNAPSIAEVKNSQQRLDSLFSSPPPHVTFVTPADSQVGDLLPFGTESARLQFTRSLIEVTKNPSIDSEHLSQAARVNQPPLEIPITQLPWSTGEARQWQLRSIERLAETWVAESRELRDSWVGAMDTSSIENYQAATIPHRERLERDVIGRFDLPLLPANARSRKWRETEKWTGFELEVDVFENVVGGGILLVPNDVQEGERRPLVVCVHGLEGRPEDTILNDHPAYHDFAARLCERGFIVFCPQQLYLGHDRFRVLQRLANPIGKTLFSVIIPQHRQFLSVLSEMPFVDRERIGFYGLSYGGKSAMRIPSVIEEYKAAICSADYNEWVLKNVSPRDGFSYVWTPEYEIFEFNLARTFNYAEMAAMICPRPFMVERGHFDGVGIDRWVAFEYAPVRFLYAAKLGIPERTEIEWFVGPHTIHGKGTFAFLHKHLNWPESQGR